MGEKQPQSSGVWPTVKPFVNGGCSGMLATCVIQPIDMIKVNSLTFLFFNWLTHLCYWSVLCFCVQFKSFWATDGFCLLVFRSGFWLVFWMIYLVWWYESGVCVLMGFFCGFSFGVGEDSIGSRISYWGDKEHVEEWGCWCFLQGLILLLQ